MSAVIRSQVTRLLIDACEELATRPDSFTPSELIGLSMLANHFDRPELVTVFARGAWNRTIVRSAEPRAGIRG